jgi:hypothetical protein
MNLWTLKTLPPQMRVTSESSPDESRLCVMLASQSVCGVWRPMILTQGAFRGRFLMQSQTYCNLWVNSRKIEGCALGMNKVLGCWLGVVVCRIARVSAATSSEEVSERRLPQSQRRLSRGECEGSVRPFTRSLSVDRCLRYVPVPVRDSSLHTGILIQSDPECPTPSISAVPSPVHSSIICS